MEPKIIYKSILYYNYTIQIMVDHLKVLKDSNATKKSTPT